jgi:hypothetical protein
MLMTFSNVRASHGDVAGQRAALDRALSIARTKLGPEHPRTKELAALLAADHPGGKRRRRSPR